MFDTDIESYAAFGQLEYKLGAFTFLAAARYTSEDRSLNIVQTSSVAGPRFNFDTAALRVREAAGQNISPDRSFSDTTPEFGINWEINEDLFANVGYLDPKFKGTLPVNLAPGLQRAPELQVKAGLSVDYPLAGVARTDGYTLLNASVGYRWNDDKCEVSVSCTNCADEEYFEGGTYIGAYASVWTGAPRFYRVNFGFRL